MAICFHCGGTGCEMCEGDDNDGRLSDEYVEEDDYDFSAVDELDDDSEFEKDLEAEFDEEFEDVDDDFEDEYEEESEEEESDWDV